MLLLIGETYNGKHSFKEKTTRNLMDYGPNSAQYFLYHWQCIVAVLADFRFLICLKDNVNSVFDYDPDGTKCWKLIEVADLMRKKSEL